jgi:hypothetical protein
VDLPGSVEVGPRDGFQKEGSNVSTGLVDAVGLTGRLVGHPLNTPIGHSLLGDPGADG